MAARELGAGDGGCLFHHPVSAVHAFLGVAAALMMSMNSGLSEAPPTCTANSSKTRQRTCTRAKLVCTQGQRIGHQRNTPTERRYAKTHGPKMKEGPLE